MKRFLVLTGFLAVVLTGASALFGQQTSGQKSVTFYGFVKFEAIYDREAPFQGDWHLFARPGNAENSGGSVFTMNARHTRLGLDVAGPDLGASGTVAGKIEFDFAGGFPNSSTAARQPLVRLRLAWAELAHTDWSLRFGQDWALISGPFPNTTSFVAGAAKGNLWMRYPQIAFRVKKNAFTYALSVNRPMAGNRKYDDYAGGDFDPVGDGERSGAPWVMSRVWFTSGRHVVSFSGHYGGEKIDDLSGRAHDKTSWSLNADAVINTDRVSFTVRAFTGENLNSFLGGIIQGFRADSSAVVNIAARGGWTQLKLKLNDCWDLTLGGGLDDPADEDLLSGGRTRNEWVFGNLTYSLTPALRFMLECDYLKTSYLDLQDGDNLRFQFVTYLNF